MRQSRNSFAILLVLLALGGCSVFDGWFGGTVTVKPAELTEFAQTAHFETRWRADLGDSGLNPLRPALTAEAAYGASGKGVLTRIARADGKPVWRVETGMTVSGGVGSGDGLVLVGSDKGEVHAYAEDGTLRWKSRVSSEVLSAPQVAEGIVIVRTGDGRIFGLDAADGKRVWLYERATPALVVRSHAGVTIRHGLAFAGLPGGKLVALNIKNGQLMWEVSVSQPRGNTELERISDITANPVLDEEQVCAVAFQGKLACYDTAQGNLMWNRDISGDKDMGLLRKYLYVSDADGAVMELDKTSGGTLWKNDKLFLRDTGSPLALENVVVAGDYEGYLHALSREDGHFVARIKLDGAIQTAPLAMDDGLLVQTRSGALYSLSIR